MTRPADQAGRDRAELARALLVDSPWCPTCRHLAWQVTMALAGKPWEQIRAARQRRDQGRSR